MPRVFEDPRPRKASKEKTLGARTRAQRVKKKLPVKKVLERERRNESAKGGRGKRIKDIKNRGGVGGGQRPKGVSQGYA